jgi:tyrosyl-tRNA synthetase
MQNIVEELRWRGLIKEQTEGAEELLLKETITLYNGFDPTGDSLHIGHLVPLMALARFQRMGHTPIVLAGGGTAMIGDPSGKSSERQLLTFEEVEANVVKIKPQLAKLMDFEIKPNTAKLVNNADWLSKLTMFEYLRDVGKHFTVNYMMAKDSVKSRIDRDQGISYTEFSYMILQAFDFLHLYKKYGCKMQTGGSDQWGNITAGTQFIRKVTGFPAQAMAYPLITRADGTKFGKTASGDSVWLDAEKTSPYKFYQFWYNTDDRDVINYLKYFTWLGREEIMALQEEVENRPGERSAQKKLASVMTEMIHDIDGLQKAEQAVAVLFGGDIVGMAGEQIAEIFADVPYSEITRNDFSGMGIQILDLLANTGATDSKSEARRLLKSGGISINNKRLTDEKLFIDSNWFIEGKYLVIRRGKKDYRLVKVTK